MGKHKDDYWFAAKSYGLGWSLPITWQGWIVAGVYAAALFGVLSAVRDTTIRLIGICVLTLALIGIVAWKGERPIKWRWGRH